MKRIAFIVCVCLCAVWSVCLAGTGVVSLSVGSKSGARGAAVNIPVYVSSNVKGLVIDALSVTVGFDQARVTVDPAVDVAVGPAANDGKTVKKEITAAYPAQDKGKIKVVLFGDPGKGIKNGVVATIRFRIASGAAGSVPLTITHYEALTAAGKAITDVTLKPGGKIMIQGSVKRPTRK